MYFWRFYLNLPKFTIPKRLKVHIPYAASSSKDCADDTEHSGLIISIIILSYLYALSVTCALVFPLPHAHMHRPISYRAGAQLRGGTREKALFENQKKKKPGLCQSLG